MSEKTTTQRLAEFIAELKYEDFPEAVVDEVKRLTLHVIGVSLAAAEIQQTKDVISIVEQKGGVEEATVWGRTGKKVPVQEAAFANGTIADIMDWEDCSWTGHPSAGAIPAAFALSEAKQLSGRDYITAVVAAYEGYQRIGMAAQPTLEHRNRYGSALGSWQIFAASLAAAKALGLDAEKINQTIGASVYAAPVPTNRHAAGRTKSDIYHYQHGTNARNGVAAADFARLGIGNGMDYLDGKNGYWLYVSDQVDESWHTLELGKRWLILETYIKHWPANMWIQTPLEVLDAIYQEHPFAPEEVEKIRLSPDTNLTSVKYSETGKTVLDAQFNASYCLAAYILDQEPKAAWFSEEQRVNPRLLELADKFEAYGEKTNPGRNFAVFQTGSFPQMTVEIVLKDGTVLKKTGQYPKGHPRNNTTFEEEAALFRKITGQVLTPEQTELFIEKIARLESITDFAVIGDILRGV